MNFPADRPMTIAGEPIGGHLSSAVDEDAAGRDEDMLRPCAATTVGAC
jgi:hypothetical protein